MATHSSVLAWRIPGTEEPGGLPSMGRTESDTTEVTQQQDSLRFEMKPECFLLQAILALISAQWPQHCAVSMIQLGVVLGFVLSFSVFLAVYNREILSLYVDMSGFPGGTVVKNPSANAGDTRDTGSISGLGRSLGGGNGRLLQCSCLENPHGQRSLAG